MPSAGPSLFHSTVVRTVVVVTIALGAFISGLRNQLLWDDATILNERLSPGGCGGFVSLWQTPYWGSVGPADTYRPLGLSVIYLQRLGFGLNPFGYRCVSIGMHALVCLLVWWVLSRLVCARVGFIAALLFAAHPVHAEAVGMVYGQLELFSAFFLLLAVGLFDVATEGPFRPGYYVAAVVCGAAAVCSKESGAMLPVLLMFVRVYRKSRGVSLRAAVDAIVRGLPADVPFWVIVVGYLYARYLVLGTFSSTAEATVAMDYPLMIRLNLLVVSIGEALRLCVLPTGQTVYYGHLRDSLFGWPLIQATWLLAVAFGILYLAPFVGRRITVLCVAWFCITFFPVSNIIPSGVVVAERTLYVPVLGICLLIAMALHRMLRREMMVAAACVLVVAAVLTANHVVWQWRDDLTLWRSTVAAHARSPLAQLQLGNALVSRWQRHPSDRVPPEELSEAELAFRAAWELNPTLTEALTGSGLVALRRGDRATAEQFFLKALAQDPYNSVAQQGLKSTRNPL